MKGGDTLWLVTRSVESGETKWWILGSIAVDESGGSEPWVKPHTRWIRGSPRIFKRPKRAESLLGRLELAGGRGLGMKARWAHRLGKPIRLSGMDRDLLGKGRSALLPSIRPRGPHPSSKTLLRVLNRAFGPWTEERTQEGMPQWVLSGKEGIRLLSDGDDRLHLLALHGSVDATFISSLLDAVLMLTARGHAWEVNALGDEKGESGVAFVFRAARKDLSED